MESTTGKQIDPEGVDHPQHYNLHPAGIECIDVIEEMSHNVGAAIKYLWRAGLKPNEATDKDLKKAIWYIKRERQRLAHRPSGPPTGPGSARDVLSDPVRTIMHPAPERSPYPHRLRDE